MRSHSEMKRQPTAAEQQVAMELMMRMFEMMSKGDSFKATLRGELTKDEIDVLTSDLKKVLDEEKMPAEKHDIFIKKQIDGINAGINKVNQLTLDNLESELENSENNLSGDALAELGMTKDSPEYLRLSDRIIQLPTMKSIINYLIDKGLELGMEKEKQERAQQAAQQREMLEAFSSMSSMWNQPNNGSSRQASNDNQDNSEADSRADKNCKP